MRKTSLRHNGNGNSGQILVSSTDEGLVRIEILPMSDTPFVDISLRDLVALVNTVKIRFMAGEL